MGEPAGRARAIDDRLGRRDADPATAAAASHPDGAGDEVMAAAHQTRHEVVEAALAGWSAKDRDAFARLLGAFGAGIAWLPGCR